MLSTYQRSYIKNSILEWIKSGVLFYFAKLTISILSCWLAIYIKHQNDLYTLDFYFSFLDESKVTKENQVSVIKLASVNYSNFRTSKKWLLSMSYRYLNRLHFLVRFKNRPITRTAIFFNIQFFLRIFDLRSVTSDD